MSSLKNNAELCDDTMTNIYRTISVAVLIIASVIYVGCKRTDDPSLGSVGQAVSTTKQNDPSATDKLAAQPSMAAAPTKSSDEPKVETKQAPAGSADKAEAIAKQKAASTNPKASTDKAQAASPEKKMTDNQASSKPTKNAVVAVPRTEHVHVDIPKGLQKLLNEDSRMQPWVSKVMKVADSCYATQRESSANAAGVIVVEVTMHPNARPDAEIKSLPPQLSAMIACATGGLMRTRMPLFTGPEGEKHTMRIHFEK